MRPQHSLDRLKNAGKPRIGVSLPAVYVSSPGVKSEPKYIEKHLFTALFLCKFALITHNAPLSVNRSITDDIFIIPSTAEY